MNDEGRLELERYFDGELPADRRTEIARLLAGDAEARRHLGRLARLRSLARSRGPAMSRGVPSLAPRPLTRAIRNAATAALAASLAAVILWRGGPAPDVPDAVGPPPIIVSAPGATVAERPVPIPEVKLYTWANQDRRPPETAANVVLRSSGRARRRPAAVEVLALDLANATPERADDLEPLALLHKAPPGGRGHNERHVRRPRPGEPGA